MQIQCRCVDTDEGIEVATHSRGVSDTSVIYVNNTSRRQFNHFWFKCCALMSPVSLFAFNRRLGVLSLFFWRIANATSFKLLAHAYFLCSLCGLVDVCKIVLLSFFYIKRRSYFLFRSVLFYWMTYNFNVTLLLSTCRVN